MHYILSIILLFSLSLEAKDFSVIVNKPFNDALFDITQDYDRHISAVGFSNDYKSNSETSDTTYHSAFDYLESISAKNGYKMHLLKVDDSANIIFSKTLKLSHFSKAVSILKTPEDGYFIGGTTRDGSLSILKVTYDGNILFKKTFGTKNYDTMNSLIKLIDGGILAIGSSITSRDKHDDLFSSGLGLADIYLTRFSSNGQKLWSRKFGTGLDDKGVGAVEADDGSIIVLSATSDKANKDVTLMRITENGDKIWLKHYKSEEKLTPTKIIKLKDNNFLVSLTITDNMQKKQLKLIKVDLQKNILIDKTIPTTYSSVINDLAEYTNTNIIAVGKVQDGSNTDGLAMIFDSNLNLLTQEHYGGENFDAFNAVTILHNSQAAVAGVHTKEHSQESNMWIVELNTDATMAKAYNNYKNSSKKENDLNFYDKLTTLFSDEISANLLSIKKDLSIELKDNSLYFKVGKYKLTKKQKNFLDKFSRKLIPFLKENSQIVKTLEINGHTSSEWKNSSFENGYIKNEKLSLNRSFEVFSQLFKSQNSKNQKWLTKILKGSGENYRKKIILDDNEDFKKSRRVSFKIILD